MAVGVVAHLGVTPKLDARVSPLKPSHKLSHLVPLLGCECVAVYGYLFAVLTGAHTETAYKADLYGYVIEAPASRPVLLNRPALYQLAILEDDKVIANGEQAVNSALDLEPLNGSGDGAGNCVAVVKDAPEGFLTGAVRQHSAS